MHIIICSDDNILQYIFSLYPALLKRMCKNQSKNVFKYIPIATVTNDISKLNETLCTPYDAVL